MKYLKRMNEDISNDDMKEYIEECFIEFYDNEDKYEIKFIEDDEEGADLILSISTPELSECSNIDSLVRASEELNEIYLNIKYGIYRFQNKYPSVRLDVYQRHTNNYHDSNIGILFYK